MENHSPFDGAVARYAAHVNPQFVRMLHTIGFDRTWVGAEGATIVDSTGERYLDLVGGFGMFNVGRNNPAVKAALIEALSDDLAHSVQLGVSSYAGALAEQLLARLPDRLERVLFTSSGTEAVEAALKYGRAATGRPRVVSADHAFHGLTLGSLSANGCPEFRDGWGPLLEGFDRVPFGDLESLEAELRREDVALFLIEPVQGKGVNLPPAGYLEGAQELCRRYGTLFCVDEVQTGFGRTGKLFALEHWSLEPDLVTMAKSLSGGYVPVGACAMSRAVFERVNDSLEHAVRHGSTFAPNELGMVAGLATLAEIDRAVLVERTANLGERLLELTKPLAERYDVVQERARPRADLGDRVRGAGRRQPQLAGARAPAAGDLLAVRRRPALPPPPDPEPGGRSRPERDQGAAAADDRRRRPRALRRRARRLDRHATPIPWAAIRFAAGAGLRSIA